MITPAPVRKPDRRRRYDVKAKALRLAQESRSTRAAACQSGISENLRLRWQHQAAKLGSEELARAPEVRALRAELQRVQREWDILKKAFWSRRKTELLDGGSLASLDEA